MRNLEEWVRYMKTCKIKGFGYAKAKRLVKNEELEQVVDTNDAWIKQRTGIQQRYISEDENTSDLGAKAAQDALVKAKVKKEEVDLIVVATFTPDQMTPSTACLIQEKLGMNEQHVMAFDVNAACSGFLYALQVAHSLLVCDQAKCALIIGAEVISKQLDWQDRSTCIIFGDGAGAMVLKQEETSNRMLHYACSKGDKEGVIHSDAPLPRTCFTSQQAMPSYIHMDGSKTFRFAIWAMQTAIQAVLDKAGVKTEDIDWFVPHQANARIIASVCRTYELPQEKVYMNIAEYGNTSAASIPIALAEMWEQGLLKEGNKLILTGFGAGFTWASTYIEV